MPASPLPEPRYLTLAEVEAWDAEAQLGTYVPRSVLRALFRTATQLYAQREVLAKLSAPTPQFNSPVAAWEAEAVRDSALALPREIYTTEARAHV